MEDYGPRKLSSTARVLPLGDIVEASTRDPLTSTPSTSGVVELSTSSEINQYSPTLESDVVSPSVTPVPVPLTPGPVGEGGAVVQSYRVESSSCVTAGPLMTSSNEEADFDE